MQFFQPGSVQHCTLERFRRPHAVVGSKPARSENDELVLCASAKTQEKFCGRQAYGNVKLQQRKAQRNVGPV